jgi:hypothetical protein
MGLSLLFGANVGQAASAATAAGAQKKAAKQAQKNAVDTAAAADRATNAANRKTPNLFNVGALANGGGASSTMLTGLNGAATTGGDLGRNTLLGA